VPLNGYLIGAHEYEGHHVFDIWYRNTSDIVPTSITGDMHSVNKANFAILHWFGLRFEPRFTDLEDQLQELYCADDPVLYEKCLIQPVGRIDLEAITGEKPNIDQIVATLGLKEMTQGTLIRKFCTLHRAEPDTVRDVRVRQAHPQHLHAALPTRPATRTERAPLAEPH
jgi:TnpA family transposase